MESGSAGFVEHLQSLLNIGDRQISFSNRNRFAPAHRAYEMLYINFINLPQGIGGAGGGAEAENNRTMLTVDGFGGESPNAPAPTGKVKVKLSMSTSMPLAERKKFRAKTGTPERIAEYTADFLNKIVQEIPPHFTHTRK